MERISLTFPPSLPSSLLRSSWTPWPRWWKSWLLLPLVQRKQGGREGKEGERVDPGCGLSLLLKLPCPRQEQELVRERQEQELLEEGSEAAQ